MGTMVLLAMLTLALWLWVVVAGKLVRGAEVSASLLFLASASVIGSLYMMGCIP